MPYISNPKTEGSGIICCIPQKGKCPVGCDDCFFQSGKSYLEPLDDNLPNMPDAEKYKNYVVRVNDGNDSNNDADRVMEMTKCYPMRFYNTSIPKDLEKFGEPVQLTLNPGKMTDVRWHKLEVIPKNLMFVRFRTNMWNMGLAREAVEYYTSRKIPVVLTFMRYYNVDVPVEHRCWYHCKKHIMNSYWLLSGEGWENIMDEFKNNQLVYSCGREGENFHAECKLCGHCLREYFVCKEKMKGEKE